MIKVLLVVWACYAPRYDQCQQLMSMEITGPDPMGWCLLNRPSVAMLWQTQVYDGWLTFTHCRRVDMEREPGA